MLQVVLIKADWCPGCHKVLERIKVSDTNLDYLKIADFEDNLELCKQSGVKSIPTVLFLSHSGAVIDRIDGDITPDKIEEKYKQINEKLK
jgi:thioredoxin